MHDYVAELLQCPDCHGALDWTIAAREGERIEQAEARCRDCAASYLVREGIGLFLTPDLPRNDLWERAESGIGRLLREQPDIERRELGVPLEALGPADLMFRAMVLEERGEFAEAKAAAALARPVLYTREYRACYQSQRAYLLGRLRGTSTPIVDLASGRGDLVELLSRELSCPIIASDFSPRIVRRDRGWLRYWGMYDRVSLLAFDARRTPFKDGAVATMTTNLGLPNVVQPERLLPELRRIVSGSLFAISCFYPEDDAANAAAIRATGSAPMLYRRETADAFRAAGWRVEFANSRAGRAEPTPRGVVIEGAAIDGLPVAETTLEWAVVAAH
jgi:uncharacterized protein YbaR (Trm112 family)